MALYTTCCLLWLHLGNSGFETAQNIVGSTAYIHVASRSRVKHAYQTHYVGDLRAINNQLVDTYQLKSLDGFLGMCVILHVDTRVWSYLLIHSLTCTYSIFLCTVCRV